MTATGETMADTEKDTTNEVVPEKAVIVTNPETLESNNRIEKMKKLTGTLKGKKGAMTREHRKLGQFMIAFQKSGDENSPPVILQSKGQDVVASNDRMRKHRDELESISNELTQTMWESQEHKLEGATPDDATTKIYEDVDKYVSTYTKLYDNHYCKRR